MNDILKKIKATNPELVHKVFSELMEEYLSPAFGSMSKRDFDILLFIKLQKMGVFKKNPEIYELVSSLRVTRSKARNLLYESKLRQTTQEDLEEELKNYLKNPIFSKDNDKINIEIDNPYLIDHLRFKLKELNHITDGSFSPEMVRLTSDAYIALFDSYIEDKQSKKDIMEALIAIGAEKDSSLKGVLKGALKQVGSKLASEAGGEIASRFGGLVGDLLDGSFTIVKDRYKDLFDNEA